MRTLAFRRLDTPLHAMEPGPKLAFVLAAFAVLMVMDGLLVALMVLLASVYLLGLARCLREWAFLARMMAALSLLVFVTNFALADMGGEVLWSYGPVPLLGTVDMTSNEVLFSAAAAVRLLAVVSVFLIVTLTVSPDALFALASRHLPRRTGLLLSLTSMMYPSMVRDAAQVADAYRSRGLDLDSGSRWARLRASAPMLRPVFADAMERSVDLAEAMAARGWGAERNRLSAPSTAGVAAAGDVRGGERKGAAMPARSAMMYAASALLVAAAVADVATELGLGLAAATVTGPVTFTYAAMPPVTSAVNLPKPIPGGIPFLLALAGILLACASPALTDGRRGNGSGADGEGKWNGGRVDKEAPEGGEGR